MGFLDKLGSVVSGVMNPIGAIAGVGTSIANTIGQYKQINYQKEMQQESWRREDNAVQRRVADLDAAGLSPVLAAGSSASASSPITIGAPDHGDIQGNIRGAAEMVALQKSIAKTEADTLRTNALREKIALQSDKLELEKKQIALNTDIVQRDFDIVKGGVKGAGQLFKDNSHMTSFINFASALLGKTGVSSWLNNKASSKPFNSAYPESLPPLSLEFKELSEFFQELTNKGVSVATIKSLYDEFIKKGEDEKTQPKGGGSGGSW